MKTDITIILDRSGSMASIADDAVGGLNTFIKEQKEIDGEAVITFVQFDNQYEIVHEDLDLKEVGELTLKPRGGTALLDAIGKTIQRTQKRFKKQCDCCNADKVIFLIITDGHENSSKQFTNKDIKKMITHQTEKHDWDFVYIGANQDSFAVAQDFGIRQEFVTNYVASEAGVQHVFGNMSSNMTNYRGLTKSAVNFFSEEDQKENEETK